MSNKKEISIERVKQITQEELQKYIRGNFSEESLRETIQSQLEDSGKNIVFKELGLKRDSWGNNTWELSNYGTIVTMVQNSPHIREIGKEVIQEVIKQVTLENVLASLNKNNIQSLKKVYRETLMKYFEEEVRNLAKIHGKDNAERLFKEYLYKKEEISEENNPDQI
jgi:Asp-tRNA(Asn)/Glu-tRNA(Gln) amidotransferase A subunit family amidase